MMPGRHPPLLIACCALVLSGRLVAAQEPGPAPGPTTQPVAPPSAESIPPADLFKAQVAEAYRLHLAQSDNATALHWLQTALADHPSPTDATREAHFDAHYLAAAIHCMQGNRGKVREHILRLADSDRIEALAPLAGWFSFYPGRADRAAYHWAMTEIVRRDVNCVLAAWAERQLAVLDLWSNLPGQYEARLGRLGFVGDWMIIGPFDNERNTGFARSFGPEQELDYAKTYQGRIKQVGWRKAPVVLPDGQVDLGQFLYPSRQALAYATTFVRSGAACNATLRLGAANAVKVWVNDQQVLSEEMDRGFVSDQYVAPCRLNAGWNRLLLKVCRRDKSGWSFAVRITDPRGRAMGGLEISSSPVRTYAKGRGRVPEFAHAKSPADQLTDRLARRPTDPMARACLAAELLRVDRARDAIKQLERLVSDWPRCSRFRVTLADAYLADEKGEKALEQFLEAVQIEPEYPAALLRLGNYYRATNRLDKAREMLDRAVKLAPDYYAAHRERMEFYSARGWRQEAFEEARWLADHCPENYDALSEWADALEDRGYGEDAGEVMGRMAKLAPGRLDYVGWLLSMAQKQRDLPRIIALYRRLLDRKPDSTHLRRQMASTFTRHKKFDRARRELKAVLTQSPDLPGAHQQLADLYQRMGRDADALAEYTATLQLSPEDSDVREYLEFRRPEQQAAFAKYGISDEQAAAIVARKPDPAAYPKASAIVLTDHDVTQLADDGSSITLIHRIVQIANENGRDQHGSVRVGPGSPRIKRAVIHKADGRTVEASKVSGGSIHYSGLEVGDTIEYKAMVYRWANTWISRQFTEHWVFNAVDPVLFSELVLLHPPGKPVKWHLNHPEKVTHRKEKLDERTVHVWTGRDFGPLESEPLTPPLTRVLAVLSISTIPDWDTVARWEYMLNKEQYESDMLIRRKAAELTADARTRQEKIDAIYEFVTTKIRYDRSLDAGILGVRTNKAVTVMNNRFGDCKDKATLMIVMLRELGIDGYYATLRTRRRGNIVLDVPANQCNHAILYVPDEPGRFETGRFYDGTAQEYGPDLLPVNDQDRNALIFHEGSYRVLRTPVNTPEQNTLRLEFDAQLDRHGAGRVAARMIWGGHWGAAVRSVLKAPGRRQQFLESFSNSLTPGARIEKDFAFSDLTDRRVPVNMQWRMTAPQLAHRQGEKLIVRPIRNMRMTATMAPREERHYDLFFSQVFRRVVRQRYRLPPGYRVESLPGNGAARTDWTRYSVNYEVTGDVLTIERTLGVLKLEAAKSDYPKLRRWCLKVDELERQQVVLAPAPKPPPASQPN